MQRGGLEWLDAKQALAEISIPGMRAIFGKRAHIARRITWIMILIICAAFSGVQVHTRLSFSAICIMTGCCYKVHDRVSYFLSTPVAVNVRVARNASLRFPVISMCNKNSFNVTAINILKSEKAQQVRKSISMLFI